MARVQIYLGAEERDLLDRASLSSGASRSELIRRAVRHTFGQASNTDRIRALEDTAGAFRGERMTGAEYVDTLRGDLRERLGRHGLA